MPALVKHNDIKSGSMKTAPKSQPESSPDQGKQIEQQLRKNAVAEFDCFFCDHCREYIYDELNGDKSRGIPPRTWVESLPQSWKCPVCGSAAEELRAVTLFDDFSEDEFKKSGLQERGEERRRAAG